MTNVTANGPASARFEALVQARMLERGEPRNVAWQHVCRAHPDLRKQMVSEANAQRPARR